MQHERTIITREKMDEMVIEALTEHPDVQLDPEIMNNLDLAQELSDLGDQAEALIKKTVDHMLKQIDTKGPLMLLEIGLAELAPRIDKRMYPPMPIVAAMYAAVVTTLVGLRYVQERGIARAIVDVKDLASARREPGDLADFKAYLHEHWQSAMQYTTSLSKKEFLTATIAILEKHVMVIDHFESGETA
jgi:hypothetical protein